jgi:hypothetical protein
MANIVLLPWLKLSQEEALFGFRFTPVGDESDWTGFDPRWADHLTKLLSSYVDMHGKPIDSAVIVQTKSSTTPWDVPEERIEDAGEACRILALLLMEQHRFFDPLGFHINSTACRPIFQRTTLGDAGIAPYIRRRGTPVRVGGMSFEGVRFQQPIETSFNGIAPSINPRFRDALELARDTQTPSWLALKDSLPFFLLGHSDDQTTPDETNVMLSAIAFETLLGSPGAAKQMAEAFAIYWVPFVTLRLSDTPGKIDPDPNPSWTAEQLAWPLHHKWAKELYEARSSHVHRRGNSTNFKSNWTPAQHIVFAAFAYPALVKLVMGKDSLYILDDREKGYCNAFDKLLANGFDPTQPYMPPRWSSILTMEEAMAKLV